MVAMLRAPASQHAIKANRSPSLAMGSREFAQMISRSNWFGTPSATTLHGGISRPSSNTSLPSGPIPSPPRSTRCEVQEVYPTIRPFLNTGITSRKSFKCPEASHGSFVMKMSPGRISRAGKRARSSFTAAAIVFMCPGVPVMAWASIRPSQSKIPAEMSPHSLTIGLKAARSRVWPCSSMMERSLFHITCS